MSRFPDSEAPTSPVHSVAIMSVQQAREAMTAFPADQLPLIIAISRAFWDDGFLVGSVRGSRVGPLDRPAIPTDGSTLAPLGKKKR